jgi:hypothetical protein
MPTAPSIAVTDLANNGGVSVAIAGDAGADHQVYRQRFGDSDWTEFGLPVVGDGVVTGALAPGYYWWYAKGSEGGSDAISPVVSQALTRDEESIDMRILDAVVATVQSAAAANSIPNMVPARVKKFEDSYNPTKMTAPGIAVYNAETAGEVGGGNLRDDFAHVVLIAIQFPNNKERELSLASERVRRLFHRLRLVGVSSATFDCVVSPGPPLAEENTILDFAWVHWQLTYTTREPRGI